MQTKRKRGHRGWFEKRTPKTKKSLGRKKKKKKQQKKPTKPSPRVVRMGGGERDIKVGVRTTPGWNANRGERKGNPWVSAKGK